MRRDHRSYFIKRLQHRLEQRFTEHFLRPQLDALGPNYLIMKPWNLKLYGPNIRLGNSVHVITTPDRPVGLSVWAYQGQEGAIDIGDYCLLCPGVRLDSASGIRLGQGCMLAAGAYLTDADWHDLYDRTRPIGSTREIVLEDNVWVGDRATLCKGIHVGENSIVAAGAIVTHDVPANVVVAGNPARQVKTLDDADRPRVTRADLFADPVALAEQLDRLERYLLAGNSTLGWLRTLLWPRQGD
ncbi:MAG: acyltransferase [Gammaproteobacteria bacterium]|nr:acyltransferase [Gammaproteobacteria bacterium]